jgi:hypothetical protein
MILRAEAPQMAFEVPARVEGATEPITLRRKFDPGAGSPGSPPMRIEPGHGHIANLSARLADIVGLRHEVVELGIGNRTDQHGAATERQQDIADATRGIVNQPAFTEAEGGAKPASRFADIAVSQNRNEAWCVLHRETRHVCLKEGLKMPRSMKDAPNRIADNYFLAIG